MLLQEDEWHLRTGIFWQKRPSYCFVYVNVKNLDSIDDTSQAEFIFARNYKALFSKYISDSTLKRKNWVKIYRSPIFLWKPMRNPV